MVDQGSSSYSESAEGKAMNIISAEKDLLLARTAKEVVQCVGRLYELLPLDQVESYAAKVTEERHVCVRGDGGHVGGGMGGIIHETCSVRMCCMYAHYDIASSVGCSVPWCSSWPL